ncbi:MAG: LarC family nickel insertion protein [Verrucomicrobiaceae bacterium]|nr:LarC family nickel insertion protein [Verrucomicrobiaceae bacterium]
MKILRYNCTSGISGDMNLSALIDLGANQDLLISELKKLNLDDWSLSSIKSQKQGIWGTQVKIDCIGGTEHSAENNHSDNHCRNTKHENSCCGGHHQHNHSHHHYEHGCCCGHTDSAHNSDCHHEHHHNHHHHHEHGRSFSDIRNLILGSELSNFVKEKSIAIFEVLAKAEAFIHNKNVNDVHFHEVGAVDSIIDIVGAVICLEQLGIDSISVGNIELGGGVVKCAHGVMPVPAPATAVMATNFVCSVGGVNHEATTPTGMAFLSALADKNVSAKGKVIGRGIGIGQRDCSERANVLQVILIDSDSESLTEKMFVVSANIDDMTAEEISYLCQKLFQAGCVDVWQQSITMKKSRLAVEVCGLVATDKLPDVQGAFFKHSSTLGVRVSEVQRLKVEREIVKFKSSIGEVSIKVSGDKFKVEADDVARIANLLQISFISAKERIETEFRNSKA